MLSELALVDHRSLGYFKRRSRSGVFVFGSFVLELSELALVDHRSLGYFKRRSRSGVFVFGSFVLEG